MEICFSVLIVKSKLPTCVHYATLSLIYCYLVSHFHCSEYLIWWLYTLHCEQLLVCAYMRRCHHLGPVHSSALCWCLTTGLHVHIAIIRTTLFSHCARVFILVFLSDNITSHRLTIDIFTVCIQCIRVTMCEPCISWCVCLYPLLFLN